MKKNVETRLQFDVSKHSRYQLCSFQKLGLWHRREAWWTEINFRSQFRSGGSDSDLHQRPNRNVPAKKKAKRIAQNRPEMGQLVLGTGTSGTLYTRCSIYQKSSGCWTPKLRRRRRREGRMWGGVSPSHGGEAWGGVMPPENFWFFFSF